MNARAETRNKHASKFDRLSEIPNDGDLLRYAFYALIGLVICVLIFDYREMLRQKPVELGLPENPVLPAFVPEISGPGQPGDTSAPSVKTAPEVLRQPLKIELGPDGVLNVTGTISVGSAATFQDKTKNILEYIKIVQLNSPGGSVSDALVISDFIRENGFTTSVSDGALCASSCPIILAGGKKRIAGKGAAIGVHQIYSVSSEPRSADAALSEGQTVTAQITRHLEKMGVDPALWLHALETPPNKLYYLSSEELEKFELAEIEPKS